MLTKFKECTGSLDELLDGLLLINENYPDGIGAIFYNRELFRCIYFIDAKSVG